MIILSAIIGTARAEQYTSEQLNTKGIQAPLAVIKPHKRDIHNDQVIDDYYWMNDFFKEGPDAELVIDYLKKENDYTNAVLKPT